MNDSTPPTEPVPVSQLNKVSFAQFAALEIKLGTITAAEVVPDADKLLRLTVEVGEATPRQIISGIREYFTEPAELIGRQCPFVTNLEPRLIRGLESQGMILAASHGDAFALLEPHLPLQPGSIVR